MQKMRVPAAAIDDVPRSAAGAEHDWPIRCEEIITQKYIANFLKAEVWNDWRRTGYPRLTIGGTGALLPGIPQRIRTPATELAEQRDQRRGHRHSDRAGWR